MTTLAELGNNKDFSRNRGVESIQNIGKEIQKVIGLWDVMATKVKGVGDRVSKLTTVGGGGSGNAVGGGGGSNLMANSLGGFTPPPMPSKTRVALAAVGSAIWDMAPNAEDAVAQRIASRSAANVAGMTPQQMTRMTNSFGKTPTGMYSMQLAASNMLYQGGLTANSRGFSNIMSEVQSLSAMTGIGNETIAGAMSSMNGMRGLQMGVQIRDGGGQLLSPSQMAENLWRRMYGSRDVTPDQVALVYNPGSRAYQNVMAVAGGDPVVFQAIASALVAKAKNKGRKAPLKNADKTMTLMGMGANDPYRNVLERTGAEAKKLEKTGDAAVAGFNAAQDTVRLANQAFTALPSAVTGSISALKAFTTSLGAFATVIGTMTGAMSLMGAGRMFGRGGGPILGPRSAGGGMGILGRAGARNAAAAAAVGSRGGFMGAAGSSLLRGPKSIGGGLGRGLLAAGTYMGMEKLQGWLNKASVPGWLRGAGNFAFDTLQGGLTGLVAGGLTGAVVGSIAGGAGSIISPYGDAMGPVGSEGGANGQSSPVSVSSGTVTGLLSRAVSYVGKVPYKFGGTSAQGGWDCSGFVQKMYGSAGVSLPRTAREQSKVGTTIRSLSEARPGDLLFFVYGRLGKEVDHVAIYLGNGEMVEAANERADTRRSKVNTKNLAVIKRVLGSSVGSAYRSLMNSLKGRGVNISGQTGDSGAPAITVTSGAAYNPSALTLGGVTGLNNRGDTVASLLQAFKSNSGGRGGGARFGQAASSGGGGGGGGDAGVVGSATGGSAGGDIGISISSAAWGNKPNRELAFMFFRRRGYSDAAAAAIVGNLMQESGVRPDAEQLKGGPGRGIAQWTVDKRWQTLLKFAKNRKMDPTSLRTQLAFIHREMGSIGMVDELKNMTDVRAATLFFENKYERAGDKQMTKRYTYADQAFEAYAAKYAKGTDRVTHDQMAMIHKDEMIIPAEQAHKVRAGLGSNNVTINVTLNNASDSEAIRLANRVKSILETDSRRSTVGRV